MKNVQEPGDEHGGGDRCVLDIKQKQGQRMTNDSLSATVCVTLSKLEQIQNMEMPSYQSL